MLLAMLMLMLLLLLLLLLLSCLSLLAAVLHQGQARICVQDLPGFWHQHNADCCAGMHPACALR
jgi:hypothetical protein